MITTAAILHVVIAKSPPRTIRKGKTSYEESLLKYNIIRVIYLVCVWVGRGIDMVVERERIMRKLLQRFVKSILLCPYVWPFPKRLLPLDTTALCDGTSGLEFFLFFIEVASLISRFIAISTQLFYYIPEQLQAVKYSVHMKILNSSKNKNQHIIT